MSNVGGLHEVPDAVQLALHVLKLRSSMVSSRLRCSAATPSISLVHHLDQARVMLPSVRMLERILPTTSSSKRRALSLGESQAPLPRFMRDWQT